MRGDGPGDGNSTASGIIYSPHRGDGPQLGTVVIEQLADGLDTNPAPSQWGGWDLSGGQWQRLAGALAFFRKDAPVLICDESTSGLDSRAEEAMYERIRTLGAGRTVILITHRLGSTWGADRIVVLDRGPGPGHPPVRADPGRPAPGAG
ncbi:hypothetical protein [Streptomyces sp. NPDC057494]|uniref:hypothetical protein n=1 Tax=Streptomyces sp. NPDC057494 TaxID=3346148 RepID=UPI0036A8B079